VRGPADSAQSLPGDSAHSLPGDSAHSLPGATLACDGVFQVDQANCTIAINVTIPPVGDATTPSNLIPGLHPADLQNRYALPSANAGGTVAIVDAYDDPAAEADLAVYRSAFGLSACASGNGCLRKVNQHGAAGAYPAFNAAWAEEISLDLDMVSAACPNCKILLVEANSPSFDDLGAAEDTAAALGAKAISNSYYGAEWSGETAYDAHYDHPGVAITVSAGDDVSPFYPAASPQVTAVGGTSLSGSSGSWTETAWPHGGQGCSLFESKPNWQGNTGCHMRAAVDVAAVADPQTGVAMFDSGAGGWLVAGGTSVGAPLVAAAYALSGNPQGPAYSYAHRSAFLDIAPSGYDLATGLGSPNGVSGF
jgi:subtilase family serine protease